MTPGIITLKNSQVRYVKFGGGPKHIAAFHGYGQHTSDFNTIAPAFDPDFTLHAFDFPFHGATEWTENRPFGRQDLAALIDAWLEREQISRFGVLGYSMGANPAMEAVISFSTQLDGLYLIAPDGIRRHPVFHYAVNMPPGRWVFRAIIRNPDWFLNFLRRFSQAGIISRYLYDLARHHLDSSRERQRLYETWMSLKLLSPNLPELKQIIKSHEIPTHLFFGKWDRLMPPERGMKFIQSLNHATLDVLPRGHGLLHPDLIPYLKTYLYPA